MRVAVLSNVNLDIVLQHMRDEAEVYAPDGYGQWIQETYQPSRSLLEFDPQALVVLLHGPDLLDEAADQESAAQTLADCAGHVARLATHFRGVPILVSNLDLPPKQLLAGDAIRPEHGLMDAWETHVQGLLDSHPNIHLFDLRGLIEDHGRRAVYSDKMWYLGSVPFSARGMEFIAGELTASVGRLRAARKKVLVVDLDNTLWGGVLGEDGAEGIVLARALQGGIFRDTQRRIKELADFGILLAIVSKNDEADVRSVLTSHPHMVLREEDFVAILANWDDKASNIARLAETLNLGLDSFVFLDDNPVEREAVAQALPSVEIVPFPRDVSRLPALIQQTYLDHFFTTRPTSEDRARRTQYQQESLRQASYSTAASLDDYLRSLDVVVTVGEVADDQVERVAQLTQKTNQFNLVTARFTNEELITYRSAPAHHVYVAQVSDRFGDSGLVFVLMITRDGRSATIDNLLMSCRVMGRHIEDAVMNAVEEQLMALGVTDLHGCYLPSPRNQPVAGLLERLGFVEDGPTDSPHRLYTRVLGSDAPERKNLHLVRWTDR